MIDGKKVLGLVIARGGSKGLPGKNLLELGGKPLVCHSIDAGLNSEYIDDVVISTEDEAIADVARKCGCKVPFMRPDELATDSAKSIDVIKYALEALIEIGDIYDYFVLLQPTTPFRDASHIDDCLRMLSDKDADSVVSVTEAEHHTLWMNELPEDMCMKGFIRPEAENKNRQDLPKHYRINGGVYAVRCSYMLSTMKLYSDRSYAYLMDNESSIDIDNSLDFELAKLVIEKRKK
ncbi:MAG: CMP-N-acetlyneuraminic acid synthetase [Denitrovibrio sp.]|nr:MAG: CMP-N-acetlyneuraminic acid synthetase [Denitrovibrio sp.]